MLRDERLNRCSENHYVLGRRRRFHGSATPAKPKIMYGNVPGGARCGKNSWQCRPHMRCAGLRHAACADYILTAKKTCRTPIELQLEPRITPGYIEGAPADCFRGRRPHRGFRDLGIWGFEHPKSPFIQ